MNLEQYVTPSIIDLCKSARSIVVIGPPVSGKSTIASYLSERLPHAYISTDHYLMNYNYDNEKSINKIIQDISNYNKSFIIEGTLGYRLLRKQVFIPDLIIKLNCNEKSIEYLYKKYRDPKKLNYVKGFTNGLNKIWNEYINTPTQNKPKLIELDTSLSYL